MKNKKGFTLIELLAVIVILAIIAVIATPIILGVVEESRKSAAVDSAYGAVAAARAYYATSQIGDTPVTLPLTIDFSNPGSLPANTVKGSDIKMSGSKPTSGKITLNDDGSYTIGTTLTIGSYYCSLNSGAISCSTSLPSS